MPNWEQRHGGRRGHRSASQLQGVVAEDLELQGPCNDEKVLIWVPSC